MNLQEFRELTQELSGELELCCAGAPVRLAWADAESCVIDDDPTVVARLGDDARVLYLHTIDS